VQPIATAGHSFTCQAAYFAPNGALTVILLVSWRPGSRHLAICIRASSFQHILSRWMQLIHCGLAFEPFCLKRASFARVSLTLYGGWQRTPPRCNSLSVRRASAMRVSVESVMSSGSCEGRAGSKRVLTTSRDNTLRIWDGAKGLAERVVIKHNNNTGRWISPLRAVWSPAGDAVICGNMGRMVQRTATTRSHRCNPSALGCTQSPP